MENKELLCCVTACGLPLEANFWDKQYQNNETGWDLKGVSPPIKSYVDTLSDKHISILIPGCGNAYEAEYLLQQGFDNVTLIDISSTLVNALKEKFAGKPINILHGDFFEHSNTYDLIIEQTFFCALNPSLRERYAVKTFQLLKENGKVAGLLFNTVFEKAGPPFGGNREEYVKLFEPLFELKQFDTCTNSVKPRAGNELFIEMQKRNLPAEYVKLFSVSGISCSGCKNTVTQNLFSVDGVTAVSINQDFTELMVITNKAVTAEQLKLSLKANPTYQINEIKN
jgi:copper chaperone CopZ